MKRYLINIIPDGIIWIALTCTASGLGLLLSEMTGH
jgi:hypothetical protein